MHRRLLAYLWFLSWFELYLEIFRHHHVTAATLAPIAYVIAAVYYHSRPHEALPGRAPAASRRFTLAPAAIWFGCFLIVLASINQLVRHELLVVDLTLRHGNTGFLIVGASLAIVGLAFDRNRRLLRHRR